MRINKVDNTGAPNPGFKAIRINAKDNQEVKYLYNKVMDITRKDYSPGVWGNDFIKLDYEKPSIIERLKELGIKFLLDSQSK